MPPVYRVELSCVWHLIAELKMTAETLNKREFVHAAMYFNLKEPNKNNKKTNKQKKIPTKRNPPKKKTHSPNLYDKLPFLYPMGKYQFHAKFEFSHCRVLNRAVAAGNADKSMQKAS